MDDEATHLMEAGTAFLTACGGCMVAANGCESFFSVGRHHRC
jgi:hypothetical protein